MLGAEREKTSENIDIVQQLDAGAVTSEVQETALKIIVIKT